MPSLHWLRARVMVVERLFSATPYLTPPSCKIGATDPCSLVLLSICKIVLQDGWAPVKGKGYIVIRISASLSIS